jgi:hypothetical protein
MSTNFRLIRRVEGRRGSVSLYRFRSGLAEVIRVVDEGHEAIELHQHREEMLSPLLDYLDEVQKGIDATRPAKRARARRLGPVWKAKHKAGGGS